MTFHPELGQIDDSRPAYRILSEHGFFAPNQHLYEQGDSIYFDGEPNEEMEPLNELAKEQLRKLFTKLDAAAELVAKKTGMSFAGRARSLDEALANATMIARETQLIKGGAGVPLMGAVPKNAHSVSTIEKPETPDTTLSPKRRGRPPGVRNVSAAA